MDLGLPYTIYYHQPVLSVKVDLEDVDDYSDSYKDAQITDLFLDNKTAFPGKINSPDDIDWIAVRCDLECIMEFNFKCADGNVVYELYDDYLKLITTAKNSIYTVPAQDVRYIKICCENKENFQKTNYTLEVSAKQKTAKSNTSYLKAQRISVVPDETFELDGNLQSNDDTEWFELSSEINSIINLEITSDDPNVLFNLFDEQCKHILTLESGSNQFKLLDDVAKYLQISYKNGICYETGKYFIKLKMDEIYRDDHSDIVDGIEIAPISLNQPITFNGVINYYDDIDWFAIKSDESGEYAFDFECSDDNVVFELYTEKFVKLHVYENSASLNLRENAVRYIKILYTGILTSAVPYTIQVYKVENLSDSGIKQIVYNGSSTLVLRKNGAVYSWGDNMYGHCGQEFGTYTKNSQILELSQIRQLLPNCYALREDGAVFQWGSGLFKGENGYWGPGDISLRKPTEIARLPGAISIAIGEKNNLALMTDGTVWRWTKKNNKPILVEGISDVAEIASADIVRKKDGTVWNLASKMLGAPDDGVAIENAPPTVIQGLFDIEKLAMGASHCVALKKDGTVWTWGGNNNGQLGNSDELESDYAPRKVKDISNIIDISAADNMSSALREDGTLWVWGRHFYNFESTDRYNIYSYILPPTPNPVWVKELRDIDVFCSRMVAKKDGSIWGWGEHSTVVSTTGYMRYKPYPIAGIDNIAFAVAANEDNLVLKKDGTVWFSHMRDIDSINNTFGQWKKIEGLEDIVQLYPTIAIRKDGTAFRITNLANGSPEFMKEWYLPGSMKILGGYALKDDGTVWSCTVDGYKTQIENLHNVKDIAAIGGYSFALLADGTVKSLGDNHSAIEGVVCNLKNVKEISYAGVVLEDGTFLEKKENSYTGVSFTPVPQLTDVKRVYLYTGKFAIKNDNTLWGWGNNSHGYLGIGRDINKSGASIRVPGLANISSISIRDEYTLAVTEDGTLWGWGNKRNLGYDVPYYYTTPTLSTKRFPDSYQDAEILDFTDEVSFSSQGTLDYENSVRWFAIKNRDIKYLQFAVESDDPNVRVDFYDKNLEKVEISITFQALKSNEIYYAKISYDGFDLDEEDFEPAEYKFNISEAVLKDAAVEKSIVLTGILDIFEIGFKETLWEGIWSSKDAYVFITYVYNGTISILPQIEFIRVSSPIKMLAGETLLFEIINPYFYYSHSAPYEIHIKSYNIISLPSIIDDKIVFSGKLDSNCKEEWIPF